MMLPLLFGFALIAPPSAGTEAFHLAASTVGLPAGYSVEYSAQSRLVRFLPIAGAKDVQEEVLEAAPGVMEGTMKFGEVRPAKAIPFSHPAAAELRSGVRSSGMPLYAVEVTYRVFDALGEVARESHSTFYSTEATAILSFVQAGLARDGKPNVKVGLDHPGQKPETLVRIPKH